MLNRQRYFDKSREYIQEKVKEAIVPSLSTLRTTQYGTADEKFLAEEIFNYALNKIKDLDDTALLHLTGNDDAIIKWYKSHLHGWIDEAGCIEKTSNVTNKADQLEHSTTVEDKNKETNDDADNLDFSGGKLLTHNEDEDHQLLHAQDVSYDEDEDDHTQLPHAQDVLHYEDDNNFPALGNNVGYKHIVDGNWFNKLLFTLTNNDDEISVQEAHQCNGENQKLP